MPERFRTRGAVSRAGIALIFCTMGILHFVAQKQFAAVVPPLLPNPLLLVAVSGVFEILGGVGILIPAVRWTAGVGLIALLIAVFPANIFMFTRRMHDHGWNPQTLFLLVRLPLQFVLIWWVYRASLGTRIPAAS